MANRMTQSEQMAVLRTVFDALDLNGDGEVQQIELIKAVCAQCQCIHASRTVSGDLQVLSRGSST